MSTLNQVYNFILEIDQLKTVFRNTITLKDRAESTAEHSWSASMICMTIMSELKTEFSDLNELKILKLCLIHDIVEIYAGDVLAFDLKARKDKEAIEQAALEKLIQIAPEFGKELKPLWYEFEERISLEAQIAKAADSICPIFQRLATLHGYQDINVDIAKMDQLKLPLFNFSKTFLALYTKLKNDLVSKKLIEPQALSA